MDEMYFYDTRAAAVKLRDDMSDRPQAAPMRKAERDSDGKRAEAGASAVGGAFRVRGRILNASVS